MKIETSVPVQILAALAEGCGFRSSYDRTPGADEWTLSAGHGDTHVQYVGTMQSVLAFLTGYAAMRMQTKQMLLDLSTTHERLILDMRTRLGWSPAFDR